MEISVFLEKALTTDGIRCVRAMDTQGEKATAAIRSFLSVEEMLRYNLVSNSTAPLRSEQCKSEYRAIQRSMCSDIRRTTLVGTATLLHKPSIRNAIKDLAVKSKIAEPITNTEMTVEEFEALPDERVEDTLVTAKSIVVQSPKIRGCNSVTVAGAPSYLFLSTHDGEGTEKPYYPLDSVRAALVAMLKAEIETDVDLESWLAFYCSTMGMPAQFGNLLQCLLAKAVIKNTSSLQASYYTRLHNAAKEVLNNVS